MITLLVVDDDARLQRFLRSALALHGYEVIEARSLAGARDAVERAEPALVLLDPALSDGDGLSLLKELKRLPVIVLSARREERDKVLALDSGADDYLTKPFGASELLARIRVALRRGRTAVAPEVMQVGPIRVDQPRHEVLVDGRHVRLTPIEFRLLVELARTPGHVHTHRQLLVAVWGPEAADELHYLRVHIGALRKKLEVDATRPKWLVTEIGVGYRLRER